MLFCQGKSGGRENNSVTVSERKEDPAARRCGRDDGLGATDDFCYMGDGGPVGDVVAIEVKVCPSREGFHLLLPGA